MSEEKFKETLQKILDKGKFLDKNSISWCCRDCCTCRER